MYGTEKDIKYIVNHITSEARGRTVDRDILCCGCCQDLALAGFGPRVGPQRCV